MIWLDAGEMAIIEQYIPHVRQIEPTLNLAPSTPAPADAGLPDILFLPWEI
jgi:hypothetical protein